MMVRVVRVGFVTAGAMAVVAAAPSARFAARAAVKDGGGVTETVSACPSSMFATAPTLVANRAPRRMLLDQGASSVLFCRYSRPAPPRGRLDQGPPEFELTAHRKLASPAVVKRLTTRLDHQGPARGDSFAVGPDTIVAYFRYPAQSVDEIVAISLTTPQAVNNGIVLRAVSSSLAHQLKQLVPLHRTASHAPG
jgi:hypothetical protein